jgi:type II secretory ATPase GspE/PulE/Tfp pilus assembly ATPase PilB-like protein
MVGEIRDSETAEIALQAAQTGHLVLSTLHTNDSVSAVTRLMDLKIQGFLIAASVSVVIAQRLVRKLCFCRSEAPIRAEYVTRMAAAGITDIGDRMYVPTGCSACDNTGYKGRVALYEMLVLNEAIRGAIRSGMQDQEICAVARNQGMRLLHEDGLAKVRLGLTTIEEISRVVGFAEETARHCLNCTKPLPSSFRFCSACGTGAPHNTVPPSLSLTRDSHGATPGTKMSYVV